MKLSGVPALRPREYATVSKSKKSVTRAYGGSFAQHNSGHREKGQMTNGMNRLEMRQLRQGPRRPRFPDRGAEDCQEGAQGEPAEEAISVSFVAAAMAG